VPRQLLAGLAQVQDTVLICPPRITQYAALAALRAGPSGYAPRISALAARRQQLLMAVATAQRQGLPIRLAIVPDGAFYALLACTTELDGHLLVKRLVLEHGVAVLPGEAFGLAASGGSCYLRLSYGMLEPALLTSALERLFAGLAQLLG
jgi:aspartate/methionine/tyrosine aminotransferase